MNNTAKSLVIAAAGLAAVYYLTRNKSGTAAVPASNANTQKTLADKMQTISQVYNPTKPATQIENLALPGQAGWGWQYYSDGVAIDPAGAYYVNGEKVWSPAS